ncbi:Secreted effector protein pipB2 [Bremerella volcania]|uniref:Secreted effector protein pipB2 n=1 Tax=Bremerella volcania TaxID=2527984 RepID=A0A518C2X4_9BACT|nr:pentapeptide repeat-containing protein [Bremerella volcania]QDU73524.1 Secreted effector protein pipB2 [Bremerella volcania]
MNKSQPTVIVAESASASKTAYNEGKLTPATLADLRGKHPNFTGDWVHLVHFETALRKPKTDPNRFKAWNRWRHDSLEGTQPQDKVVHLEGVTLRSVDLRGIHLEGAVLRDATIAASDFRGARLAGAVLQETNLSFCDFAEADMTGIQLQDSNLDHANLRSVTLDNANLEGAVLTSANVNEAQCHEASFERAKLTGANFTKADAAGASFRRANLADVIFEETCLDRARLSEADLNYANLQNASLKKAEFQRANLYGATAHGADCEGADFTAAILRQANLGNCNLRGTQGLLLDQTFVSGGEFDAKAGDPWTKLLQHYTWKKLAVISLVFSILFIPYFLGSYFKPPKQLIERPVPKRVEEISENFFKVPHTDYEIDEFLRFRHDNYYAPLVSNLNSPSTWVYLALGGVDGILFTVTVVAIIVCLLQRIALTRSVHKLHAANVMFRRTPKLEEYMGPYSPIGEEPCGWPYALMKWLQGHFVEVNAQNGQQQLTVRPFRWLRLPSWWLEGMQAIRPLWKVTPNIFKRTPPPSWIDTLGLTRMDRMNQSMTWGILVIVLFMLCRVAIELILGNQLTLGG